ncbi:hypothetical protein GCM10011581_00930 [Saccharopolyspora subtropica]|uniref:Uncharacterized protein n=1 Tax=Saccharopolyspora thermophila TaxID=89367 RepID=A0A917N688_9PSEU|nr:hypothetical protein [Saccharopolyspora subtropica]GGI67891.1 hypothetical protein GCM10011581_00930 [Saccharopolyspora subtropica]
MSTSIEKRVRKATISAIVIGVVLLIGVVSATIGGDSPQNTFTSENSTYYSDSQKYSGPPIQRFTAADARQLAQRLAEAEKAHGVCFGWKLVDGATRQFDQGSSRGPGIPASTCPRWAEVQVFVAAAATDDDLDAADLEVEASSEFTSLPDTEEFVSLGVTADSLAEEPVTVTGQAALGLPLLLLESGALQAPQAPAPVPGNQAVPPLPPGDGSGSSWVVWAWLGGLGAVVVIALVLGFVARAKQQKSAPDTPAGPPPAPQQPGPPLNQPPWPPQGPPPPRPGQPPQGPPWPPQPPRR